jgi:DsbC/DsbD-like thiol-disulfide interchange protein
MITFTIRDGYHIQANKPLDVNLIPTELTIIPSGEFMIYEPKFPAPVPFQLKNDPEAMMVFDGKLEILLPIVVRENTKNGSYQIKGNLKYQACDSVKCYFPRNVLFEVPVQVR